MRTGLILTWSLWIGIAGAQSIDCSKSSTADEKLICVSPALTALDSKLAAAYRQAQSRMSPDDLAALHRDQTRWISNRRKCATAGCIQGRYESRLIDLERAGILSGVWKITGFTPSSAELSVDRPAPGATVEFRNHQLCVIAPAVDRDCRTLSAEWKTVADLPGGAKLAVGLHAPASTRYALLILDGRAAFGFAVMPDGRLFSDVDSCSPAGDCKFVFEIWQRP